MFLLSSRLPFSWPGFLCFFLCCHATNPPFRSAYRGGLVKDLYLTSLTRVSNHHDFFVKLFSDIFEIIFTSSRAIIFFGAREIVFVSPLRKKIVDFIFITFHSGFGSADIVRDDHVAIFCAQFFLRVCLRDRVSPPRSRRQDNDAVRCGERRENVARRDQLESEVGVFRFFIFCDADCRWFVIGDRRAHHEHIAVARRRGEPRRNSSSLVVIEMNRARRAARDSPDRRSSVTSCPASSAASAIAYPIFPEERLLMKRTGSIGFARRSGGDDEPHAIKLSWRASRNSARKAMSSTFHKRPTPSYPHASIPSSGPMNSTPRDFQCRRHFPAWRDAPTSFHSWPARSEWARGWRARSRPADDPRVRARVRR